MTELKQVYKCEVCGNIVEILHAGKGQLVCCNRPMLNLVENTVDASKEKHIPVITREGDKIKVSVGSTLHPMEEKHYIEWIEIIAGGIVYRKFLQPGNIPEAEFICEAENVAARAYCNIHSLWKG